MNSSAPNAELNINNAVEYHWKRHKLSGAPPVPNFFGFTIPIREFSQDKYTPEGVYQGILVAGGISYDDGFPADRTQTWPFCYASTYHLVLKQIFWVPCDAERLVPLMEQRDGYPNNEAKG